MFKFGTFTLLLTVPCFGASRAATYVVTSAADAGAGSLRQAILDANANPGPDEITFNIPGGGVQTIVLSSALPDLSERVYINGQTQPGYDNVHPIIELNGAGIAAPNAVLTLAAPTCEIVALAINRGPDAGIRIKTPGNGFVGDCFIGTDPTGRIARGNAGPGVVVDNVPDSSIGYGAIGRPNVIAANGSHGVLIIGAAAGRTNVDGNAIGTDYLRTANLPNAGAGVAIVDAGDCQVLDNDIFHNADAGVRISGAPATPTVIQNNRIAYSGGPGVAAAPTATRVRIRQNYIHSNSGLGIDLGDDGRTLNDPGDGDAGANNRQNYPVLLSIVFSMSFGSTREGDLRIRFEGSPSSSYFIELIPATLGASLEDPHTLPNYSFRTFNINTDAAGVAEFTVFHSVPDEATHLTALVTDAADNTSEFATAFALPDLVADSGACGTTGLEGLMLLGLLALVRASRGAGKPR